LQDRNPAAYAAYQADDAHLSPFLFFAKVRGIDPVKLGEVQKSLKAARAGLDDAGTQDPNAALAKLTPEQRAVIEASIAGDRQTLKADSLIPAAMAVIYLLLLLYFKAIGGYRVVHIGEPERRP
jgi:hypothetical protein